MQRIYKRLQMVTMWVVTIAGCLAFWYALLVQVGVI